MDLNSICRICLRNSEELVTLTMEYTEICETCIGVRLQTIKGSKICSKCSKALESLCSFKLMILESEFQWTELTMAPKKDIKLIEEVEDDDDFKFEDATEDTIELELPLTKPEIVVNYCVKVKVEGEEDEKPVKVPVKKKYKKDYDKMIQCEICGLQVRQKNRSVHLRNHENPLECHFCQKKFTTKQYIANHIQAVHFKIARFPCEVCNKMFKMKSVLNQHMKYSHLQRNFICNICGKGFVRQATLDQHIEAIHNLDHRFPCPHCDATLNSMNGLKNHVATSHQSDILPKWGELNVKCVCGYQVESRLSLRQHVENSHKQGELYNCPCGRVYQSRRKLVTHFEKNHGIKAINHRGNARLPRSDNPLEPFLCNFCNETFKTSQQCSRHRQKHIKSMMREKILAEMNGGQEINV